VPPVVFTPWVQGLQRFLAEALLPVIHAPVLHQDRDGHYQVPESTHLCPRCHSGLLAGASRPHRRPFWRCCPLVDWWVSTMQ